MIVHSSLTLSMKVYILARRNDFKYVCVSVLVYPPILPVSLCACVCVYKCIHAELRSRPLVLTSDGPERSFTFSWGRVSYWPGTPPECLSLSPKTPGISLSLPLDYRYEPSHRTLFYVGSGDLNSGSSWLQGKHLTGPVILSFLPSGINKCLAI